MQSGVAEKDSELDPMLLEAHAPEAVEAQEATHIGHADLGPLPCEAQSTHEVHFSHIANEAQQEPCDTQHEVMHPEHLGHDEQASTTDVSATITTPGHFLNMISAGGSQQQSYCHTSSRKATNGQAGAHAATTKPKANAAGPDHAVHRAQMVLMKKLGVLGEQQLLTQEAREAYANLFEHPLSPVHIVVLAALFGWVVPDPSAEELATLAN